jgi:hypothetical protein
VPGSGDVDTDQGSVQVFGASAKSKIGPYY